jgi:LmbE family N-acetylglucosaminyl deacetylase
MLSAATESLHVRGLFTSLAPVSWCAGAVRVVRWLLELVWFAPSRRSPTMLTERAELTDRAVVLRVPATQCAVGRSTGFWHPVCAWIARARLVSGSALPWYVVFLGYIVFLGALLTTATQPVAAQQAEGDGKLRIIVFGAHPDDAEFKAGGTAALWARQGHHVKLVSVTNGDIGHWQMAGGPLAQRRAAEVAAAAKTLGVVSEVLDIHDGELVPSLENRRIITRLIRQWRADVVISHRPWDYHPDHRYVGVLVQDAAFMVTVPFFCPDVPALERNPVFLFSSDRFQKPYPFQPDIVVAIDEVFEQKLEAIHQLASQVYEGGANGSEEFVRSVPPAEDDAGRRAWLRARWHARQSQEADRYRDVLIRLYGDERGRSVKYAEAFEICEYGRQPDLAEIKRLFPFFE